jgi:hypothetical protein
MRVRYEWRGTWEVDDCHESTSGKLSDSEYESCLPLSVVPGDGTEVWGKYI